jgi:hypothetical protein
VPLLALLALAAVGGVLALTLLGGGDDGKGGNSSSTSAAEKQQRAERRRARREKAAKQRAQAQTQQQQPATPAAPVPAPDSGASSNYKIPQPSGDSAAEGSRLQLQGHEMIDSDPKGAVKVLERSVKAFPAGSDDIHLQYAYFSLGKALRLSGRPEDAIPVLELRLKNPDQRSVVKAELDRARSEATG